MEITILVDNNTIIDKYLLGEPAFSALIEKDDKKILFDTGYSDAFIKNSITLGKDIFDVDYIVLSHSHPDHTWGLEAYLKILNEKNLINPMRKRIKLLVHPDIFRELTFMGRDVLGMNIKKDTLNRYFDIIETKNIKEIIPGVHFLGEIALENDFENKKAIGKKVIDGIEYDDYNKDDSAIAIETEKGTVILTGCSHPGVCNIVQKTKKELKNSPIIDIIGGLHLLDTKDEILEKTANYLKENQIKTISPCHCTDLKAKIYLSKYMTVNDVATGSSIQFK